MLRKNVSASGIHIIENCNISGRDVYLSVVTKYQAMNMKNKSSKIHEITFGLLEIEILKGGGEKKGIMIILYNAMIGILCILVPTTVQYIHTEYIMRITL